MIVQESKPSIIENQKAYFNENYSIITYCNETDP